MNNKEAIINFIVIIALVGYVVCSIFLFIEAFELRDHEVQLINPALMHVTSALTGLVGGIVAAAFGITSNEELIEDATTSLISKQKMKRIGEYALSGQEEKFKERIGNLYAWAYILVGISSLIIWGILNTNATQSITSAGTTFLGMVVAIVGAFFKE